MRLARSHAIPTQILGLGTLALASLATSPPLPGQPCPDLVIAALEVTSWNGTNISYAYTVTNIGTAPANLEGPTAAAWDNISVQALVSADIVYDGVFVDTPAGGNVFGPSPIADLAPGASISDFFISSPALNTSTTPYLVMTVDPYNREAECNEDNNTAWARIEPGTYGSFHSGCAGSNGFPTLRACPGSAPLIGTTFCAEVTNLPINTSDVAVMVLGFEAFVPPISLDVINMPGCPLLVNFLVPSIMARTGTTARWSISIPNSPALIRGDFYNQVFVFDSAGALPAVVSNACDALIG